MSTDRSYADILGELEREKERAKADPRIGQLGERISHCELHFVHDQASTRVRKVFDFRLAPNRILTPALRIFGTDAFDSSTVGHRQ